MWSDHPTEAFRGPLKITCPDVLEKEWRKPMREETTT